MSCDRNGRRSADAASRNGIAGYINRYLNTLSSWSTYQDLKSLADVPQRVLEVTGQFFGLNFSDEETGWRGLRPQGILAVILAVHLAEQFTGAVATAASRAVLRGRPFGRYRGITLRESPISPRVGRGLNVLLRGRVEAAKGFYFFEGGRTWHCHVGQYRVPDHQAGDIVKTLTHIQSLSWPNREYFFDRELPPQDVVDLALGDRDPDTIPGFIGGCNELDSLVVVTRGLKRLFYFGGWLLIDDGERDAGGEIVDYDRFGPDGGRGGGSSAYRGYRPGGPSSPGPGGVGRTPTYPYRSSTGRSAWAGSGRTYGGSGGEEWTRSYQRYGRQTSPVQSVKEGYGSPPEPAYTPPPPEAYTGSLWEVGATGRPRQTINLNGQEVEVSVQGMRVMPDGRRLAEAYYRGEQGWLPITDEKVCAAIAQDVDQGLLMTEAEKDLWAT